MDLQTVREWSRAAIIDDWRAVEHKDGTLKLERDGFSALVILRDYDPQLYLWGRDGLAVQIPVPYSWRAVVDGMNRCEKCPDYVGVTERAGFANRVCPACATAMSQWTEEVTRDFSR